MPPREGGRISSIRLAPRLCYWIGDAVPAAWALFTEYCDSLYNLRVPESVKRPSCEDIYSVLTPPCSSCDSADFGCSCDVRADGQIVEFEEGTLCVQRLDLRHVDSGCDDFASLKCFLQTSFIDDRTTCAVDENRRRFHLPEGVDIENMVCLGSGRGVNCEIVGLGEKRIEVDQLNPEKIGCSLWNVRIAGDDFFRPKTANTCGKCFTDVAESEDADGGAGYSA